MASDGSQVVASPDRSKPVSILIVEDEALVASYIEEVLGESGFRVAGVAASGAEALSLAAEHRPDSGARRYPAERPDRRDRTRPPAARQLRRAGDLSLRAGRRPHRRAGPLGAAARLPEKAVSAEPGVQRDLARLETSSIAERRGDPTAVAAERHRRRGRLGLDRVRRSADLLRTNPVRIGPIARSQPPSLAPAMIILSKLADYGVIVATHLAAHPDRQATAAAIAAATRLPPRHRRQAVEGAGACRAG